MFDDNDYIKERSILLGQVAEARAREKRVLAASRNLKVLLFLSLILLPLSHCWFGKTEKAQLSEKSRAVLMNFREEQLNINFELLQQLTTPDSTFTYIVQEGDYPESLSQKFYGDTKYAYMIMLDNQIGNDRRLIVNDTLLLRHKAEILDKNIK
jgi:hypothetical protein